MYSKGYLERVQLFKDAIALKQPARTPNMSNFFTWKICDSDYSFRDAIYDYDVMKQVVVDFHNRYDFDAYMDLGTRNPIRVTDALGGGSHCLNEEGTGINVVDDVPASVNKWLLTDVLREQWGWDGFVVSDYTGISECILHGVGDYHEVGVRSLNAGMDMDMVAEALPTQAIAGLKSGEVTMKTIDRACRRVLEAKYKLGLFDDPYKFCREDEAASVVYSDENRAAARRISGESYVLLRNEGGVLPLARKGTVAVVGPLAKTAENMPGTWSVAAQHGRCTTLLDGIKEVAGPDVRVLYAKGSNLCSDYDLEMNSTMFGRELGRDGRSDARLLAEAVSVALRSDVVIAALGEASEMSGECSSRTSLDIPDVQKDLLKALLRTGKPVVLVLFDGRPLTIEWESRNVPAILNVWFGGTEAAYSIADVLFGDVNPSGKLPMTFPKNVGQIPVYYAHKNTGRPLDEGGWFMKFRSNYLDVDNDPVYPFGYGLSYTTFEYGPVTLSAPSMKADGSLTASVTVTNTGAVAGKEVVQMYVRDVKASSSRPVRELKGFEKVLLQPGESREVSFEISVDALSFWNQQMEYVAEPGEFVVYIGGDSRASASASFELL